MFLFGFVFELLVVVINVFHFLKNYSCCDVNGINCYCSAAGVALQHLLRKTQGSRLGENGQMISVPVSVGGKWELCRQSMQWAPPPETCGACGRLVVCVTSALWVRTGWCSVPASCGVSRERSHRMHSETSVLLPQGRMELHRGGGPWPASSPGLGAGAAPHARSLW